MFRNKFYNFKIQTHEHVLDSIYHNYEVKIILLSGLWCENVYIVDFDMYT